MTRLKEELPMTLIVNICTSCGGPVADSLSRLGSLRCHDCRDVAAPITARRAPRPRAQELAHREGDGLEVTLVWYAETDRVAVRVNDTSTGDRFELRVARDGALDAFNHPFAYAPPPRREIDCADCALAYAEAA
jgi:hypothetical protein